MDLAVSMAIRDAVTEDEATELTALLNRLLIARGLEPLSENAND